MNKPGLIAAFFVAVMLMLTTQLSWAKSLFVGEQWQKSDAILVKQGDKTLYQWQSDVPLIPASVIKIVSAQLAIDKWGLEHRFHTDFYLHNKTLWVKGYGDPFLVSEEIDVLVKQLKRRLNDDINRIAMDVTHFDSSLKFPGSTSVVDPYNAPLSALAANFNTVKLNKNKGVISSAEPQTPLTATARRIASGVRFSKKTDRINLVNADNAQRHFAEILLSKLDRPDWAIDVNAVRPEGAVLLYRHSNNHTLSEVLRSALEYSNNFIANQVFLGLAESPPLSFNKARSVSNNMLKSRFNWPADLLKDGAGLSRNNRLTANQIDQVLDAFADNKQLLKRYQIGAQNIVVYAKTGTLNGVRSYTGYIDLIEPVKFVFIFNRQTPWRYRERLLERLVTELLSMPLLVTQSQAH